MQRALPALTHLPPALPLSGEGEGGGGGGEGASCTAAAATSLTLQTHRGVARTAPRGRGQRRWRTAGELPRWRRNAQPPHAAPSLSADSQSQAKGAEGAPQTATTG